MGGLVARQRSLPDKFWMERKVSKSIYGVVIGSEISQILLQDINI
jgi:hypothetical protein